MKSVLLVILAIPLLFFPGYSLESRQNDRFFDTGYASFVRGEYDKALSDFGRFIDEEKIRPQPRHEKMVMMYRYQAVCLENLSLYVMAENSMQEALSLSEHLKDSSLTALCLEQMAGLFRKQGKPGQASMFLEESLVYFRAMNWLSHLQENYLELARLQYDLGNYGNADRFLALALDIRNSSPVSFEKTYIEDEVYFLQGMIAFKKGKMNVAGKMLLKADSLCRIYEKALTEKSSLLIKVQLALAEIYRLKGKMNLSAAAVDLASRLCSRPSVRWMKPLVTVGKVKLAMANGHSDDAEKMLTALIDSQLFAQELPEAANFEIFRIITGDLIQFWDSLYAKSGNTEILKRKLGFLEKLYKTGIPEESAFSLFTDYAWKSVDYGKLNNGMVETAVSLYRKTNDKIFLKKAFYYTELGTLAILNGNLLNSLQQSSGDKRAELIALAGLKNQINAQLAAGRKNGEFSLPEKKSLMVLIRDAEKIQGRISIPSGYTFDSGKMIDESFSGQLQSALEPDEAYLKFADSDKCFYIFLLTRDDFLVENVDKSPSLLNSLAIYKDFISQPPSLENGFPDMKEYMQSAFELYYKLFGPFSQLTEGKELITETNGVLKSVSFDALLTSLPDTSVMTCRNLPFLIRKYDLRSSGSSTLYIRNGEKRKTTFHTRYAGFAPFGHSPGEGQLPGSGLEVRTVSEIMGGKAFSGRRVTKNRVSHKARKAAIIHLATHAIENPLYPQLTELALYQDKHQPDEENRIFYYEIIRGHFDQQLVVLGACGSSDGKYIAGYGTVSLANAFLASGARGVLAARWKVDDSASAKMISHFFRLISGGERFHSALRQVKLSHIEHAPEQMLHPHLWANYSYFGSIQKLEPVRTAFSLMWLILPVVILASGYFFLKRFHRRAEQKS